MSPLAFERVGPEMNPGWDRRAELRDHGLVLVDSFFEPVEVDLASVFEATLDSEAWSG